MATESTNDNTRRIIEGGRAVFGLELGSTRIKATAVGPDGTPLAVGSYGWENRFEGGFWTYHIDDAWTGLAACFDDLLGDIESRYGVVPSGFAAGGISGMMHGYVALDSDGELLVPFRTWRNNTTGRASEELTKQFAAPVPQRWSIAHLFQAILDDEDHVGSIARITTLAGYVHWKLTGRHVIGMDEASGMFPLDPATGTYSTALLGRFDELVAGPGFSWKIGDLLPEVGVAGEPAGSVTAEGAKLLDPKGRLDGGIPLCPPEGDAGTGMIATNSIRPRTGNVSAGTSVFAMIVLERPLSRVHPEIDLVVTPDGNPVAMAHSNNCTSDFDAWVSLFGQAFTAMGIDVDNSKLISTLAGAALDGDPDAGGLLSFGYVSGEHMTGFSHGRPLFVRRPDGAFTLANFFRAHLYSALCALRAGLNILFDEEGVDLEELRGHGGFFKTPDVGARLMAAATKSPVSLMETAGEGGAWGMALLALYASRTDRSQSLASFLDGIFSGSPVTRVEPQASDVEGFQAYFERYMNGLPIERAAVDRL